MASRVEPDDRWRIAAYIRVLQLSQNAPLDDVPADQRARSIRIRRHRPLIETEVHNDCRRSGRNSDWRNGSDGRCWRASPAALLAIAGFLLNRRAQFLRSYLFAYHVLDRDGVWDVWAFC